METMYNYQEQVQDHGIIQLIIFGITTQSIQANVIPDKMPINLD